MHAGWVFLIAALHLLPHIEWSCLSLVTLVTRDGVVAHLHGEHVVALVGGVRVVLDNHLEEHRRH